MVVSGRQCTMPVRHFTLSDSLAERLSEMLQCTTVASWPVVSFPSLGLSDDTVKLDS